MKILRKTSLDAGKKVVLITSEASLLPIAGAAGVYVAKTLQSQPAIPEAPEVEATVDNITEGEEDTNIDQNKSIGELAGVATAATVETDAQDKPIELGDDDDKKDDKSKDKKTKGDKKLKVPNFNKFRVKILLAAGGLIILITAWVFAAVVLPKATIAIRMQYTSVPVSLTATATPSATALNEKDMILPAKSQTLDKTSTKPFQATGQKNNGNKATGTMTIYNCTDPTITVPAGTTFTNNGLSFTTNSVATVPGSNFNQNGGCKEDGKTEDVPVTANSGGDNYNLSAGRTYASNIGSTVYGEGSAMAGGTNKIVTVISQLDCDTAKNDLLNAKTDVQKTQLASQISAAGFTAIQDSFNSTQGATSCSPNVGDEASQSTASVQMHFTMLGVNTSALSKLIESYVAKQDGQANQKVYITGVKTGRFTIKERKDDGSIIFIYDGVAKTGVKQDTTVIAKSVAGQKYGKTVQIIRSNPGIIDVQVKYSPFWVKNTPKDIKHITVTFASVDESQ